ncbi:MAG TPA: c-type cytochrome domain-containing protein [Tepidisphaeraceae bacterium]|nr:c-type cytochrome domain-containing protein [Tepidisphaeraceae bacterium]
MRFIVSVLFLVALFASAPSLRADDKPISYFHDVRPILMSNCNACHKPEKLKGELDLTAVSLMLKGGKHGPAVIPGNTSKSKMIEMISGDDPDMPKDADPLQPVQVSLITRWIQQGAADDTPKVGETKIEPPVYSLPPVVTAMAYSPDGALLAVAGYHEVLLHKSDGSEILARLTGEAPRIESIAFSRDGKLMADCGGSPGEFGLVQIWNVADRKLHKGYEISGDSLYGISIAPDSKTVAFGGADKIVHRIDIETGKELLDFKAHADWVLGTCFTLDGKQLVSAGRDKAMKLIDLDSGRFVDDINNPLEACLCIARNPKQEQVLYGGDLGAARLYKISDNQGRTSGRNDTNLIRAFEKQAGPVTAVAFAPDGNEVALGSMNDVNVYAAGDGKKLHTLSGEQGPVFAICYKPDGKQIAVAGYDGMVRLYDAKAGNLVRQFLSVPVTKPPTTKPAETRPAQASAN